MIIIRGIFLFIFCVNAAWTAPSSHPVLQQLRQMHEDQEREKNRLQEMQSEMPLLTYAKSKEFATQLAGSLYGVLNALTRERENQKRTELLEQAKLLLETVSLLSEKIDPDDQRTERIRAYEKKVERRRLPVKALFAAAGLIDVAAQFVKGHGPHPLDILDVVDEHRLKPFEVSEEEWPEIQAKDFIQAFTSELNAVSKAAGSKKTVEISLLPGIGGALKSEEVLVSLLKQQDCVSAMLGGLIL